MNTSSIGIPGFSPKSWTIIVLANFIIRTTSVDRCSRMNFPIGASNAKKSSHAAGEYWNRYTAIVQRDLNASFSRMTYTKHRSTQETLQTLDSLELDTIRSTTEDLIKKFGWEDDSDLRSKGYLPQRKRLAMIIWQIFAEPRSSVISKVRIWWNSSRFAKRTCFSICLDHHSDFNFLYPSLHYHLYASNLVHVSNSRI